MTEPGAVASAFAELTRTPLADAGTAPHLARLLRYCLALTEAEAADVLTAGGEETVCEATTERARALLDLELAAGSGPTLDCLHRGEALGPVHVAGPSPWPHIVAAADAAGYTTAYAHPLRAAEGDDTGTVGALVLYAHAAIDADHRHLTQALADTVAGRIAAARTVARATARADQLQRALDSRVVIEQAKGVLAERHHTTPEAGFLRLRAQARNANAKLAAVAATVVAGAAAGDDR